MPAISSGGLLRRAPPALGLVLLLAGCGPHSALAPAGSAADSIGGLWWLMFWGAWAVWALVMVLLLLPLRRPRARRRLRPLLFIVGGGVVLPVAVVTLLLVAGSLASARITGPEEPAGQRVRVVAKQWQWRFDYLDEAGHVRASSVDRLWLPLGEWVQFEVSSEDVIHSFWIPRLGGKIDAIPGRSNRIRLRADRDVPIRGQCAEFCGREHALMAFEVDLLAPAEFRRRLRQGDMTGPADD